jgi:ferredoxin
LGRAARDAPPARLFAPSALGVVPVTTGNVVFLVILLLAAAFLAYNAQRLYRYATVVGKPENRFDHPGKRLWNLLTIGFAQTKILRDPTAGTSHAAVFWGFLVVTIGTLEVFVQGVWNGFSYANYLPAPVYALYALSQEVFALIILAAVSYLIYRRVVIKPKRLQGDVVHGTEAVVILSVIALLMLTLLLTGTMEAIHEPDAASGYGRLVGHGVALGLSGVLSPETAHAIRNASWWTHAVLVLGFINFLPYSKHLHVLVSLPNVFFSNTSGPGPIGVMRAMDLEDENAEQFGASDVEHLSWKSLLDGYACTECGRCTAACPANIGAATSARSPTSSGASSMVRWRVLTMILRGLRTFPVRFAGHAAVHRPHSVQE